MAWAMWACFGLLPMLVAMTVFGATELYMFGTNWAGATLRHDWLALLAFAACALRRQRWLLAGALLGFGTMLRVLPAVGPARCRRARGRLAGGAGAGSAAARRCASSWPSTARRCACSRRRRRRCSPPS